MKKLLKYLKGYRREVILGPVFKLTEAILELLVPLVMANIIDRGVKNADSAYVLRMGGLMVLLSAIGLLCALICQYFAAKASQGFGTVLRNKLFSHIGSFSHAEIDRFGTPTLVTRVTNDVTQLQQAVAMFIRLAVRAPFLLIGATVMAMAIDFETSIIFLIAAGGIALVLYLIMSRTVPFYGLVQKLLDRVSLLTRENLAGARVIRAFSKQKKEQNRFDDANSELMDASLRVGRLSALLNPITFLIVNAGIIAILWFGGMGVNTAVLEQGQIIALVNYMTQILLALVVLANLVVLFTKAGASAVRVNEVLDTQPSVLDGGSGKIAAREGAPIIEFKDVYFTYEAEVARKLREGRPDKVEDGDPYELYDVDLKITRGQMVGVIGGTGAGKSTLVHLIPRFYDATYGSVLVDGEDVRSYPLEQLRGKIGIVPQKSVLFAGTLRDNMRVGNSGAVDEQIEKALRVAQAAEFVGKWEEGLDTHIQQNGRNLSGGQRQRLAIARALVREPEILILDDAASALDFATEAALRRALKESVTPMTVIMVSQRASTLRYADQIIVLDDGEVSGIGTHEELFETNAVYREICLTQMDADEKTG